jgi:Omp85 superfamily domain
MRRRTQCLRTLGRRVFVLAAIIANSALAQAQEPATREAMTEQEQAEKSKQLHPYVTSKAERFVGKAETILAGNAVKWHPFFQNAYPGGGFAVGAGYAQYVSPYNLLDLRGSYSIAGYKRAEAEFTAPHLFHRRGSLTLLGGWREATQVAFYGLGNDSPSEERFNYGFQQPRASGLLEVRPTRRFLMLRGGFEFTKWDFQQGEGTSPSVGSRFTPADLPGLDAEVTYRHFEATGGFDWRVSSGYARRGGSYTVTLHDYRDSDKNFGFRQLDYDLIQHLPILREAWVLSFHALASTTDTKDGQRIPFFMLPYLGSGSTLRGFPSFRFRDRNALLLQGEWRIMVNRFLDTAFFYDAGKVAAHTSDLDFDDLHTNYGFGVRFHGPFNTPLRVEVANSREGLRLVFASSPVF